MDWNEVKNGNEEVLDKQELVSLIEELRFRVGVRVWRLDCWREADYVTANPSETTPEDLANLSELHEKLYWFYEAVLFARNQESKPAPDSTELDEWYSRIISEAHRVADTDVKALIGWTEIEQRWNEDSEFRSLWSEVKNFDDILRNTLDAGFLCRRVIRWYEASESERNERHQQMFAMKELLAEIKARDTNTDEIGE